MRINLFYAAILTPIFFLISDAYALSCVARKLYFHKKNVLYYGKIQLGERAIREVTNVDKDSFFVVGYPLVMMTSTWKDGCLGDEFYGKDKSSVYYGHIRIKEADPVTFSVVFDGIFSTDETHLFYKEKTILVWPSIFSSFIRPLVKLIIFSSWVIGKDNVNLNYVDFKRLNEEKIATNFKNM